MTYSEKLRHPLWQKKRLQILERDKWKCCSCGSTDKNLQVHHLVYWKKNNPWDYADDCLQTLCEECHEIRQELTDKAANAVRLALKNISTQNLLPAARMMISLAQVPEPFHQQMVMELIHAIQDTEAKKGPLDMGLWSDLVMDLMMVQVLREKPQSDRAVSSMKKAIQILEEKYGAS